MGDKKGRQSPLPDYRLAKAFKFTSADLTTNRLGFMTRTQEWALPVWSESGIRWLQNNVLAKSGLQRRTVLSICGKIEISEQLHDVHGGRFQIDFLYLKIVGTDARFKISQTQKVSLQNNATYRIYYQEPQRILSLEKVANCE